MKTMINKYFAISALGTSITGERIHGVHIIRAKSHENALLIRERYGISNPWGAIFDENDKFIYVKRIDLRSIYNRQRIERRRKGQGSLLGSRTQSREEP